MESDCGLTSGLVSLTCLMDRRKMSVTTPSLECVTSAAAGLAARCN